MLGVSLAVDSVNHILLGRRQVISHNFFFLLFSFFVCIICFVSLDFLFFQDGFFFWFVLAVGFFVGFFGSSSFLASFWQNTTFVP